MSFSYNPLWKLLIDKGLKKKDLREMANISKSTMDKMYRNGNISLDIIDRICNTLECDIEDIIVHKKEKEVINE